MGNTILCSWQVGMWSGPLLRLYNSCAKYKITCLNWPLKQIPKCVICVHNDLSNAANCLIWSENCGPKATRCSLPTPTPSKLHSNDQLLSASSLTHYEPYLALFATVQYLFSYSAHVACALTNKLLIKSNRTLYITVHFSDHHKEFTVAFTICHHVHYWFFTVHVWEQAHLETWFNLAGFLIHRLQ